MSQGVTVVLGMRNKTRRWRTVGILSDLFFRIQDVIGYSGHASVSEYVRFAVHERLKHDEAMREEQKMLEEEIKERLE